MSNPNYLTNLVAKKEQVKNTSDPADPIDKFHQFSVENYLKKCMAFDSKTLKILLPYYSTMFGLIAKIVKGEEFVILKEDVSIFEQIENVLLNTKSRTHLSISSIAGCGKSEFLTILYQYLYYKYKCKEFSKLPIYISLHYYNKKIYQDSTLLFSKQGGKLLKNDISELFYHIKQFTNIDVVLIIDGCDEFNNTKVDLDTTLNSLIEDLPINCQIIGLRNCFNKHCVQSKKEDPSVLINDTIIDISFGKISSNSDAGKQFIRTFAKIEELTQVKVSDANKLTEYIFKKISLLGVKHLDMFHLFLFSKGFQNAINYKTAKNLGAYYEIYLSSCNLNIKSISEIAFKMFNHPNRITKDEKNTREWWKVQKSDSLRDYLAAAYLANKLIINQKKDLNEDYNTFNYVYPFEINAFCKDIINESIESQQEAYRFIIERFWESSVTAKTHFCYLLGRFHNERIKKDAHLFLKQNEQVVKSELDKRLLTMSSNKIDYTCKQYLLYYRTICISLICLGDTDTSDRYIAQLLNNKYFDTLNRGFHLEYYEDIVFSPSQPDTLNNEDDGQCDCSKTFQRLYTKIKKALDTDNIYPLFQVELYTLCSLIQHRQANKKADPQMIDSLLNVIEQIENQSLNLSKDLNTYILFVKEQFEKREQFSITHFIEEIYQLKLKPRKGWVNRNVMCPESIASHMYGALLLAYLHLPDQIEEEPEYKKEKILKMLLVHDIGETYVGDWTPSEKTEKIKQLEDEKMKQIALIGTYNVISSNLEIYNLFHSFTYDESCINAKIARDIDKLDNLIQLIIYNKIKPIDDFDNFISDLVEGHKYTSVGCKIRDEILESMISI